VIHLEYDYAVQPIAVPVWAWLVAALAVMALLAITMANGATLAHSGNVLHEFFHDARHFVGVPCH
jgi:hypothetical protein